MNQNFIPIIVLIFLIPLFISPETVTAIDLDNEKFKVIVTFEIDRNPNELRGIYQFEVDPVFDTLFTDLGLNFFNKTSPIPMDNPFGYSHTIFLAEIHDYGTNPIGDFIYQIYPLVTVTGDNPNLSQTDYNTQQDIIVAEMRLAIVDMLLNNGAYNVKTLIHFSFGGVDIDEGF